MYTVMLVDDEYMILRGLEKLIPWEELNLSLNGVAKNGEQALALYRDKPSDIIISDITMPLMTGLEFVRELHQSRETPLIIFLSGYQEFDYVREGLELGAISYLVKPIDRKELISTLQKATALLEERKAQLEAAHYVLDNHVFQWVHNSMTEKSFELLKIEKCTGFQAFYSKYYSLRFLEQLKDNPAVHMYMNHEKRLVGVLVNHSKEQAKKYFEKLPIQFPNQLQLFVGSYQEKYTEVYHSYEEAERLFQRYFFYDDLQRAVFFEEETQKEVFDFHSTLLSMDGIIDIEANHFIGIIDSALSFFEAHRYPPHQVKYLTTVIIADAQRLFRIKEDFSYQTIIEKVSRIHKMSGIVEVMTDLKGQILKAQRHHGYSELTQGVVQIIRTEYRRDLMLKSVADQLHVSAMYLGQVIKKETKMTFSQLLNDYRIKKSQELLLKTRKTVHEVSYEVGYGNVSYFHRNFKENFGMTPKEFREKYLSVL